MTAVHNHLEVVLPDGDFRDDVQLTTAANNALAANVTVPAGVEATAEDGDITLTGTVAYGTERAAAEAAVSGLRGVRNLIDDIDISYDLDPVDVDLHVQEALDRLALVPDGSDVKAEIKDGVITLTGHVRNLGRVRSGGRSGLDGQRGHRRPGRPEGHRLTGIAARHMTNRTHCGRSGPMFLSRTAVVTCAACRTAPAPHRVAQFPGPPADADAARGGGRAAAGRRDGRRRRCRS